MKHSLPLFLSAVLLTGSAWALDKDSRPGAGSFEISTPSRYRVSHALTLAVTGMSVTQTSATVPKPVRFPWSAGAGIAAYEAAVFSPLAPAPVSGAGPWQQWTGTAYAPYWLELQNGAAGEAWRWTLLNPAAGSHQFAVSYEFTTADRRFRRELAPLTLSDLADPAKMPPELRGVKAAIRALTEPVPGQAARSKLPPELVTVVDEILADPTHGGDLYKVLTRLSKWLTDRISYSADPDVLASPRENLYANLVRGTGDCGTFSCTFAAMANAAGIPARVVMGMNCRPFAWPLDPIQPKTYRDTVGWHVWVEVFLPGLGWTEMEPQKARAAPLNPTNGEPDCDLFALSQYTQHQLAQGPLWEGASSSAAGSSVSFRAESDLVPLSGPRAAVATTARPFPVATLSAPAHASRAVRGQPISVTAQVTPAGGAIIEQVYFWVKQRSQTIGAVFATTIAPPYAAVFTPEAADVYEFSVWARDSFGIYSAYSSRPGDSAGRLPGAPTFPITEVQVVAPGTPPAAVTCQLTAPAHGAEFADGSLIYLMANPSGAGVTGVDFYIQTPGQVGWTLVGANVAGPPYQMSYQPTVSGAHKVLAYARVGATRFPADSEAIASNFTVMPSWSAWRARHFTNGELNTATVSGALADPAARGIRNLQAYAFGLTPRGDGWVRLPRIGREMVNGVPCLTLTYWRPSPKPPEISYAIHAATEFGAWTTINPELPANVLRSSVTAGVEEIVVRDVALDATAPRARWLRLEVSMP